MKFILLIKSNSPRREDHMSFMEFKNRKCAEDYCIMRSNDCEEWSVFKETANISLKDRFNIFRHNFVWSRPKSEEYLHDNVYGLYPQEIVAMIALLVLVGPFYVASWPLRKTLQVIKKKS